MGAHTPGLGPWLAAEFEMRPIKVDGVTIKTAHKLREVRAIHGHGTVTKEYKTLRPQRSMCSGCYDDHYNHVNKDNGGCWAFETAKVVNKVGYTSIHVGYGPDGKMTRTLSCWHAVRK